MEEPVEDRVARRVQAALVVLLAAGAVLLVVLLPGVQPARVALPAGLVALAAVVLLVAAALEGLVGLVQRVLRRLGSSRPSR